MAIANLAVPFDTFTLAASVAQMRRLLLDAKVQKVYQPSANEIVLATFGRVGGARRIELSADPRLFRAHLTTVRRENPPTPPTFCQLCRRYLEDAEIADIVMPRFDRLLHLTFRAEDGERFTLAVELMGRNANIALVSGAGLVRGAIRPTPAETTHSLRPGATYALPPGSQDRIDPLTLIGPHDAAFASLPTDPTEVVPWLMSTFSGIGRFAAEEIVARAPHGPEDIPEALSGLMEAVRTEQFEPHALLDAEGHTVGVWPFPPLSVPPARRLERLDLAVALDTLYAAVASESADESEKTALARLLEKEAQYRQRELQSSRRTVAEAARAEEYEQTGNNLLAALTLVRRGADSVSIPDLYSEDGREVTVTLDPKRTPQENAQSFFDRARKTRDAAEYAEGRLIDLEEDLFAINDLLASLGQATGAEDYANIRTSLAEVIGTQRASGKSASRTSEPSRPFGGYKIRTYTVNGFELLVGDSAEANDYLTTRVGAPTDLWMHVRSAPGAHAILRTQGQPLRVPDTVVRRAAEIVAARSGTSVKHAGLVAVDVTEKRYVRKPRGSKPGIVSYMRERTLDVEPTL